MAIVKMSEFKLIVPTDNINPLLKSFQAFADITFRDLSTSSIEGLVPYKTEYDFEDNLTKQQHITSALQSISEYQKKSKKEKKKLLDNFSVLEMTYDELENNLESSDLDDLLGYYAEYYESITNKVEGFNCHIPWNKERLSMEQLLQLDFENLLIGTITKDNYGKIVSNLNRLGPIYYITKEYKDYYVVAIVASTKNLKQLDITFDKYDFKKRSAVSLGIEHCIEEMETIYNNYLEKRRGIEGRLTNIGMFKDVLQMHYEMLRNEELYQKTKNMFLRTDNIVYIEGWIITEKEDEFKKLVSDVTKGTCELDVNPAPADSEDVPIKLKNNKLIEAFEQITNMYSQPRYNEIDPTPIFAPFYAIFFGMMLADFGYGLLMGVAAFTALKLVKFKPSTEKFIRLFLVLSFTTMLWGIIYGSFFGDLIPMKAIINISQDFTYVLVLALVMGIVHLLVGLGVKGYLYIRDGKSLYVLFDVVFWYLSIIGAAILISQMFTDILASYNQIAMILMVVGMVGIVLTNGREAKTVLGKGASGLYSLYGLTNYIGDVVSYSRLMALGLAGASIGMAFNMIAGMLAGAGPIGVVAGALVFILLHAFNLFINGLSAYVHSARLVYVEFFGKFYEGGGKPFTSFRATPTYININ